MPRYYHCGPKGLDFDYLAKSQSVDDEDFKKIKKDLTKHHPLTMPNRENLSVKDGKIAIKKPGLYCQYDKDGNSIPESVPWEPGSIAFGLPGYGFYVVPPGGHVDLDVVVTEKMVKDAAPHLLTEAEYLARKNQEDSKKQQKPVAV